MDDHQGSKKEPGLTRGQLVTALRLGSEAVGAEQVVGWPGMGVGADGSQDRARAVSRTGASITLAMIVAGTLTVSVVTGNRGNLGDSGDGPPSEGGGRGSILRGGVGTVAIQANDSRQEQQKMFARLTGMAAATAVGVSTTIAGAQATAVQWRVEDGGNGHWYQAIRPTPMPNSFAKQDEFAGSRGAKMVSIDSSAENSFVAGLLSGASGEVNGAFIGLRRQKDGSWRWSDGMLPGFTAWGGGDCAFGPYPNDTATPGEMCGHLYRRECGWIWDDSKPEWFPGADSLKLIIEWSADCNADGIVDYGQCRDGSLPDYDGNNVPDCCENGQPCAAGNHPVQWRVDDGGNGHWYRMTSDRLVTWIQARADSMLHGGELASIGSSEENEIVFRIGRSAWIAGWAGPWIGGMRTATGWEWSDGSLWEYTAWDCANPSNSGGYEDRVHYAINGSCSVLPIATWNDAFSGGIGSGGLAFVTEWSADCNNDGIVDYGQILLGQLSDLNANGIPDTCEASCSSVDLDSSGTIDGADLGTLLANWGVVAAGTPADIDGDGTVGGADLGLLLSFWGPCAP